MVDAWGSVTRFAAMACVVVMGLAGPVGAEGAGDLAGLLASPETRPGLLVLLDCADGRAAVRARLDGKYVVQACVADAATLRGLRAEIRQVGAYGPVSAILRSDQSLPYADDMVNVVVAERFGALRASGLGIREVLRVLAPYGAALLRGVTRQECAENLAQTGVATVRISEEDGWVRIDKPYPSDMDEWRHRAHDASWTYASGDRRAGPLESIRWIGGEKSIPGRMPSPHMVSADGRAFFLSSDRGRKGFVEARDAFNGMLLWDTPTQEGVRAFVADGARLHVLKQRVEAWDAASGRKLFAFDTDRLTWPVMLLEPSEGVLVLGCTRGGWLGAFEARTGRELWEAQGLVGSWNAPNTAIGAGRVYYLARKPAEGEEPEGAQVVRVLDLKTGRLLAEWSPPFAPDDVAPFCLSQYLDGKLTLTSRGKDQTQKARTVYVVSASDGKPLWNTTAAATDVSALGGLLHLDGLFWRLVRGQQPRGHNPQTGEVMRTLPDKLKHVLCGPMVAMGKYVVAGRNSLTDVTNGTVWRYTVTRLSCRTSCRIANGLIYYPRHTCACTHGMNGNLAISGVSQLPEEVEPLDAPSRLEKGSAYPEPGDVSPDTLPDGQGSDWPTYRANALRGAVSSTHIPAELRELWTVRVGNSTSAPVIAEGRVLIAAPEEHAVVCLDAQSGARLWTFVAGGRVDSPPTLHEGLVLFGSRDGWVFALRATDGALVWKRRLAPGDRQIVVQEQLESLWPVFGSVLVHDGVLYAAAGRHVDIDGGLWVAALEPTTGRPVWTRNVRNPDHNVEHAISPRLRGEGGINDILRSDGKHIYISGCFDKMAMDAGTGAKVAGVTGLPILSTANDMLMPPSHRFSPSAWGDPTAASIIWTYHPGPAAVGMFWQNYHGADRTAPRFDTAAKWGYAGDALAFDGPRVFGAGREQDAKRTKLEVFGKPGAEAPLWLADPKDIPEHLQGVIVAGDTVIVALGGVYDDAAAAPPRGRLLFYAASDGDETGEIPLPFAPRWEGLAASRGLLYVATDDGRLACFGP
jgi:outer membrane protein assembly factor BamB